MIVTKKIKDKVLIKKKKIFIKLQRKMMVQEINKAIKMQEKVWINMKKVNKKDKIYKMDLTIS